MAAAFATRHFAEYFMLVEKDVTVTGRQDLLENPLVDEDRQAGLSDKKKFEKTGFKTWFKLVGSSSGVNDREGEFTYSFNDGIINTHEEVFELGVVTKVIGRPSAVMYEFGGKQWRGKADMVTAIKDNQELYNNILAEIKKQDFPK
jgi:hypothetical protein